MITIKSFKIKNREILIAVIFDKKIQGVTFSFDGREFLQERMTSLTQYLQKRGVNVELEEKESSFPELVYKILIGDIENKKGLKDLSFEGTTAFEKKVYDTLTKKVKRGEVITYGNLAKMLRSSPRAIGGAMKRNPYPIIVPCHRVIASNNIGNYTPKREYKRFLLEIEGVKKWIS
ncbi:DUF1938 domain-containing protein [Thermococcus sp. MV5]|uniref:methylated-DNA--protein-cysteine methyltransferase n=1 Tax=Thermococcus sp. MV5 TaxID=1638272 RepID=UPI00143A6FBF|nr:methylated-DNA--protein-cysteine methyltransferase [Thermococcus sp. MV5]NJE26855.1 DUF1938 domain-containing protein [Thermococcus sp. MV5]